MLMAAPMFAKAEFAYEAGAEVTSAYLWRGMYNGGLSFQPTVSLGYEGEFTSLSIGAWASLGASDWKFQKGLEETEMSNPNTYFVPEVDFNLDFSFFGINLGAAHYYYCDKTPFLNWQKIDKIYEEKTTSQTEVYVGYTFETLLDIPLSITWNTMVAGADHNVDTDDEGNKIVKRGWSSYLEINYTHSFAHNISLGATIGMSPWRSDYVYYNEKFAVVNLDLRFEKGWEVGPCTFSLFAEGSINPSAINKENVYINLAGDDKIGCQTLNGTVGLGLWF